MRIVLAIVAILVLPVAAASPTYWNYSMYGVGTDQEGDPYVYRQSCAGYGREIPRVEGSGIRYPVGSAPDPIEDCKNRTRGRIVGL